MKTFISLLALLSLAATNQTYTVKVGGPGGIIWQQTNCVLVTNHSYGCTLILWVDEASRTNEFHAWMVPLIVTTNQPAKR